MSKLDEKVNIVFNNYKNKFFKWQRWIIKQTRYNDVLFWKNEFLYIIYKVLQKINNYENVEFKKCFNTYLKRASLNYIRDYKIEIDFEDFVHHENRLTYDEGKSLIVKDLIDYVCEYDIIKKKIIINRIKGYSINEICKYLKISKYNYNLELSDIKNKLSFI